MDRYISKLVRRGAEKQELFEAVAAIPEVHVALYTLCDKCRKLVRNWKWTIGLRGWRFLTA